MSFFAPVGKKHHRESKGDEDCERAQEQVERENLRVRRKIFRIRLRD